MKFQFTDILRVLIPLTICIIISTLIPIGSPALKGYLMIFVLAVAIIYNSPELNFSLILGFLPIDFIVTQNSDFGVLLYVMPIVILKDFVFNRDHKQSYLLLAAFMIFFTWEILHIYSYSIIKGGIIYKNNIVLYLTIFYICLLSGRKFYQHFFEIALIIISLSVIFSFIYGFSSSSKVNESFAQEAITTGNYRIGGFGYNVNRFAGFVIIVLSSIPLAMRRSSLNPIFLTVLFILVSAIGLFTGSRSFLLTYAVLIIINLFFIPNRSYNRSIKVLMIFILFLIALLVLSNLGFLQGYLNQINERSLYEKYGGNSRSDLFSLYLGYLISNPEVLLFGSGINSYFYVIGYNAFPHNLIIEPFVAWGIFGVISLVFLFYQLVSSNFNSSGKQQISLLTSLPLACFILQSVVSSRWTEPNFYLILAFGIRVLFIEHVTDNNYRPIEGPA